MESGNRSGRVFDRIMLKLSGESLMGELEYGTDHSRVQRIATQVTDARATGLEIAIVVGAGQHLPRACRGRRPEWTGPPPTTWGCWPRSSTP